MAADEAGGGAVGEDKVKAARPSAPRAQPAYTAGPCSPWRPPCAVLLQATLKLRGASCRIRSVPTTAPRSTASSTTSSRLGGGWWGSCGGPGHGHGGGRGGGGAGVEASRHMRGGAAAAHAAAHGCCCCGAPRTKQAQQRPAGACSVFFWDLSIDLWIECVLLDYSCADKACFRPLPFSPHTSQGFNPLLSRSSSFQAATPVTAAEMLSLCLLGCLCLERPTRQPIQPHTPPISHPLHPTTFNLQA